VPNYETFENLIRLFLVPLAARRTSVLSKKNAMEGLQQHFFSIGIIMFALVAKM
jgi:hypothetical protein